jgi:uncharacterized protein (DUF58 family)
MSIASSSVSLSSTPHPGEWVDIGVSTGQRGLAEKTWRLLWHLLLPQDIQRTRLTRAGAVLVVVALGIGLAAYNNANNVLFMALSLLLSTLVLSGLLSWVNFRGVLWRMRLPAHWRAGEPGPLRLELANRKKITPTYSLLVHARTRRLGAVEAQHLPDRLNPGGETILDWMFNPQARGLESVEITAAESQFPFGFLRKSAGGSLRQEIWVWPARVEYEFKPPTSRQPRQAGDAQRRLGAGADLLGLRPYRHGDAPRLVHWKATARLRELVVRQTGEEQQSGYHLIIEATQARWPDAAQFERLCSFAASLAEDLFTAGKLRSVTVQDGPTQTILRLVDLQTVLDRLARVEPAEHLPGRTPTGPEIITFQPGTRHQVHAYLGGQLAGAA